MNMSGMNTTTSTKKSYMHMTLFWSKNSEILFTGWPGSRGGMYALALVAVFAFAALVEWLNHARLIGPRRSPLVAGLARAAMHAVRMGLAYLVMLALMSFNVGVLIVAIAGHVAAYFLFDTATCKHETSQSELTSAS